MKLLATRVLLVLCTAASDIPAHAQEDHVGWIEKIDENCAGLLRGKDPAKVTKLDSKRNQYRFLYPADSVRCENGGSMLLQVLDNPLKKIEKRNGWCVIDSEGVACERDENAAKQGAASSAARSRTDKRAVERFGRPAGRSSSMFSIGLGKFGVAAGRSRGFHSKIFSPAEEGTVRADDLVFRWNEIRDAAEITLVVADKYHAAIWKQENVEATAGELASESSRKALREYRGKGIVSDFHVQLIKEGIGDIAVNFSILSAEGERGLAEDLAKCEEGSSLRWAVCRTYAFTSREMWNAAAEEYEAALKLAPESEELIRAALAGETSVRNEKRMAELRAKLPPEGSARQ